MYVNRYRGGWCEWLYCDHSKGNWLTHNGIYRMAYSGLTGLFRI